MKSALCILLGFMFTIASAQQVPKGDVRSRWGTSSTAESIPPTLREPFALKAPGHYTLSDWRKLIDSAWGPGLSTAQKLVTFDAFWNQVDQLWGGFPNLVVNWDSLRNVYRPQVAVGVSRGRFAGIMSRLTRALNEWHVFADDTGIDSTMGIVGRNAGLHQFQWFRYKPRVPLANFGDILRAHFGAGVTCLADSLALVYSVMPNHPLGLNPGDIILGYDGIPWKQLVRELLDAELPILGGGAYASTPAGANHSIIKSAGANWGLFDTIDILKYPGNDTLHYPTSLLESIVPPYLIATEQLPVKGVACPDLQSNKFVSWGVIEGTSIGYVYAWDWEGVPEGNTRIQFGQAIDDLMHTRNVTGLILDFRTNIGGLEEYANDGFKHLFNFDPTNNYSRAWRIPGSNHFSFNIAPAYGPDFFIPTPEIFDRPIAVLTGPLCGSAGDYNAFRMRFHPMVRFFGKPTAGAYTDLDYNPYFNSNGYRCRVDPACVYSNVNNEAYMIHKPFPVDEDVWLTRDGVAKGEDDVVKRALGWMDSLSYAHDVVISKDTIQNPADSIFIMATVENPRNHQLAVFATVATAQGSVAESVLLTKAKFVHLWVADVKAPGANGRYTISVRTNDVTSGTYRSLPNVAWFTAIVTDVDEPAEDLPRDFSLHQNYPNPFNPSTTIRYGLPARSHVSLAVFNTLGQQVAVLQNGEEDAGYHDVKFDATTLSSGVYFYRIQAGEFTQTKRLGLVR